MFRRGERGNRYDGKSLVLTKVFHTHTFAKPLEEGSCLIIICLSLHSLTLLTHSFGSEFRMEFLGLNLARALLGPHV